MPLPIIPGDKRTPNKLVVEALASESYYMELNSEPNHRVWAYRQAAWSMEDLEQDIGLVYRHMGLKDLESIQNVGPGLAQVVERLLKGWMSS